MRFHDVMCSFWSVYMYLFKSVSPVCWMYMYIVCAASVVEWIVLALCTLRKPVGTSAAAVRTVYFYCMTASFVRYIQSCGLLLTACCDV